MKDVTDEFAESLKALKDSFATSLADGIKEVKDDLTKAISDQGDECNKAIVSLSSAVMTHRRESQRTTERSRENHDRIDKVEVSLLDLMHKNSKLEKAMTELKSNPEVNLPVQKPETLFPFLGPLLDRIDQLEKSNLCLTGEISRLEKALSASNSKQDANLPVEEAVTPFPSPSPLLDRIEQVEQALSSVLSQLLPSIAVNSPTEPQAPILSIVHSCLDRLSNLEHRSRRRSSSTPPKND
ncbi:hypothetical protein HDE_02691 [Halotydeus destructor]|nr:hypothetical protein HDE_02691 [Halotydeus destructor]